MRPILKFVNINVKINNQSVPAFIDTGSSITVLSYEMFVDLKLKIIQNSSINIRQISGLTKSIGRVKVRLTIKDKTKLVNIHVIKDFKFPLLLGLDVGEIFNLHIDLKNRKVRTYSPINPESYCFHISEEKNKKIRNLLKEYKDCFAQHNTDIGRITIDKHYIRTIPHAPISMRPYRRSQAEYDEIRRQVEELKDKKLIRDSQSPYAFPVSLVPKKDGGKRLVINYIPLNKVTIDDKQPLPHIQDVFDRLRNAKYFSVLDIAWGYWHLEMHPSSIEKTAFVTNSGHYEWLALPMGLKNAPSLFERIIQKTLAELLWNGVINYLDDFIVYTETFEQHIELLKKVFEKLRTANIKLKLSKCNFAKSEVEYLGHIISENTIKPSPNKIRVVKEFPQPKNLKKIQRFLGLTGYYRKMIQNYTEIAYPLTQLTRKDNPFIWTEIHTKSFNALKDKLTSEPVLTVYDPKTPCELHTDASKTGIAGILMQRDKDNNPKVIAYYSRRLNTHEENYSVSEQELLAVVN
jgi:hypothetical protein